jgi:F0F1-type ATP synthase assembly protein I
MNQKSRQNNKDLYRYAGLSAQLFAGIALAVFVGYKLDKWLKISAPLFLIGLPVLSLLGMFYRIIKDTSKRKDNHAQK